MSPIEIVFVVLGIGLIVISCFLTKEDKQQTDVTQISDEVLELQKKEAEKNGRYTNGQINNICKEANWKTNGEPITQTALYEAIDETEPDIDEELIEKFNNDFSELIQK